jgi:hypothetical protein
MPERWERELRKLRGLEPREQMVREQVERGPSRNRWPGGRERVIAGLVAGVVFVAAAAFAREAFLVTPTEPEHRAGEAGSLDMPALTINAHAEPGQSSPPEALARYGDVEAVIPVQGGEGWGMGNAFPSAMFGPHEAAIPVGAPMLIESNADQVEVSFDRAYPDGDLIPQSIDPGSIATLPSEPGQLLIQVSATWQDGRAEFSVFVDLYAPVDVLDVDCRAHRVPVWQSRVVRAHPDGIHATFQADVSRDLRIDAPGFRSGVLTTLEAGDTSLQIPIPPGVAIVGCNNAPDSQITVVDPGGFWAPAEVACPSGDGVASVAAEETGERLIDEATIVERLLTVQRSDEVVPPGYPEAVRAQPLPSKVVLRRDGQIIAELDVWLGIPARVEGVACSSAGIQPTQGAATAMPPSPSAVDPAEIVVRIEGLGRSERSRDFPVMTMSFGGETALGCTEAFEWTTADLTRIDEVSGRSGSILPQCSYDPLFVVPPRTPIVVETERGTEVSATRTTTPFFTGIDGVGVSVTWPDGNAVFLAYFEVRWDGPVPRNIVLDCSPTDRIPFPTPEGGFIMPGGSAFIRGNMTGFLQSDVIEQMTKRDGGGAGGWDGTWQVVRNGSIVAAVEFPSLSGVACRGSGIGGA